MNERDFDAWLDESCQALPRSIEPSRDLWPQIEVRLNEPEYASDNKTPGRSRAWPFAAGVAATALVAIMALQITQRPVETAELPPAELPPEVAPLVDEPRWVPEVRRARNDLQADYAASLDNLSPETRAIVEENLEQIHKSLAEIHAALAQDPGNAALHRLLAGTYQQELNLFSSIGALRKTDTQL